MLSFLWPKKQNDLRLQVQDSVLAEGLDQLKAVAAEIEEVKAKLEAKANGALVRLRGLPDEIKSK